MLESSVRVTGLCACLFVLVGSPCAAAAQSAEGVITVGPGVSPSATRVGTFNVGDAGILDGDDLFQAAIDEIKTRNTQYVESGGTIRVLPGRFVFNTPVVLDVPGLAIRGQEGAELDLGHVNSGGIFTISASNVLIDGLRLVDESMDGSRQYMVEVAGPSAGVGLGGLTIRNCCFELVNEESLHFFGYLKLGGGASELRDLRVLNNEFFLPSSGSSILHCVEATGISGLQIMGNAFRGSSAALPDKCLLLKDVAQGIVVGNTFQQIGSSTNPALSVIETSSTNQLTTRGICISGNSFEDTIASSAVSVDSSAVAVNGNSFGATLAGGFPQGKNAVDLLSGGSGAVVVANTVFGYGKGAATLKVSNLSTVVVGNQFSGGNGTQIDMITATACLTAFNTFVSLAAAGPVPAITLSGGGSHHIFGCDAQGGLWSDPLWSNSTGSPATPLRAEANRNATL